MILVYTIIVYSKLLYRRYVIVFPCLLSLYESAGRGHLIAQFHDYRTLLEGLLELINVSESID